MVFEILFNCSDILGELSTVFKPSPFTGVLAIQKGLVEAARTGVTILYGLLPYRVQLRKF